MKFNPSDYPEGHPLMTYLMDIPSDLRDMRAAGLWLLNLAQQFESQEQATQFFADAVNEWYRRGEESTRAARMKREPEPGFVYLMRNKRNGLIKIGYSKDPKFREATLQSEEPEVEMIHTGRGSRSMERALHEDFSGYRVRGEWFQLNDGQIGTIKGLLDL